MGAGVSGSQTRWLRSVKMSTRGHFGQRRCGGVRELSWRCGGEERSSEWEVASCSARLSDNGEIGRVTPYSGIGSVIERLMGDIIWVSWWLEEVACSCPESLPDMKLAHINRCAFGSG